MNSQTIIEMLAERPFVPLLVSTNDGKERIIAHPELAIVGDGFLVITMKPNPEAELPDRGCFCALANITSIEPADQAVQQDS
ncbi:MAG: hypothetical protein MI757_09465 [Pirellulales bacterium]|nr:hypothetical protein [Pirellulales bacterium]